MAVYNKADMWALGCILHELCIGRIPFREDYHVREYGFGARRPEEYGIEELKVPPSHDDRSREAVDLNVIRETIEQPVINRN
jgi:serine/threonine protein kinase